MFRVKKNQPALHGDCVQYFESILKQSESSSKTGMFEIIDKVHGRVKFAAAGNQQSFNGFPQQRSGTALEVFCGLSVSVTAIRIFPVRFVTL